jgi:hypothetical protein
MHSPTIDFTFVCVVFSWILFEATPTPTPTPTQNKKKEKKKDENKRAKPCQN